MNRVLPDTLAIKLMPKVDPGEPEMWRASVKTEATRRVANLDCGGERIEELFHGEIVAYSSSHEGALALLGDAVASYGVPL